MITKTSVSQVSDTILKFSDSPEIHLISFELGYKYLLTIDKKKPLENQKLQIILCFDSLFENKSELENILILFGDHHLAIERLIL